MKRIYKLIIIPPQPAKKQTTPIILSPPFYSKISHPLNLWESGFLAYQRQSANFYIISRHLIYLRESSGMVEVIHRFHGHYPFGLKKQAQNTYMEILKQNQSEEEIAVYRQKNKIYRDINNTHFIKLHKMLREGNNLYFLYEYCERSLENYIGGLQTELNEAQNRERYRTITHDFRANIDAIIDALVKAEIKADLFLSNFAYVHELDKGETFFIKTFIDCDAEYLSITTHAYRAKQPKRKDKAGINQQFLHEFYEAERKRLIVEFDEVLQKKFGKVHEVVEKKQTPNFVINGTKLVFINNEDRSHTPQQQNFAKSNKIANNRVEPQHKFHELSKSNHIESKSSVNLLPNSNNKPKTPMPVDKRVAQEEEQKKIERKIERIVNFDQSFEPDFKPEEFTKQNTYIFQENDYLDSLEEEINKLANQKKMQQSKKSTSSEAQKPKQQQKIHKNSSQSPTKKQSTDPKNRILQRKDSQPSNNIIASPNQNNLSNNHSNNHSNSNISNQSEMKIEHKQIDIKAEKVNKYKMKIITSHEIEIEGGDQPNVEEIQREIIEGLRTGKLNINELSAQKGTTSTKNQVKNQINTSNQNNSKDLASSSHANKSHNSDNSSKDTKQITSNLQKPKKHTLPTEKDHSGSSDSHQAKMRSINEIIDKINLKYQSNQVQQPAEQPKQQPKVEHKQIVPNIPTVSSTPQHKMQKVELTEPVVQKGEKAQNYINKIREAKNKAEQILREYTKKKQ